MHVSALTIGCRSPDYTRWRHFQKPNIRSRNGFWSVTNARGSVFHFPSLDVMRQRWDSISPYYEKASPT